MNPYTSVPIARPGYSVFDLSHNKRDAYKIGPARCSLLMEVVPGDYIEFAQTVNVELAPLFSQFKGDLNLETVLFFGSYDLLFNEARDSGKFSEILTSITNVDPETASPVAIPKWSVSTGEFNIDTLWDTCGFPTGLTKAPYESIMPIGYIKRLYNLCYNEYFRDENLDEERDLEDNSLFNIRYKKDIFTSAFKSVQKGIAPTAKLKGSASIVLPQSMVDTIVGILVNINQTSSQVPVGTPVTISNNSLYQTNGATSTNQRFGIKIDEAFINSFNNASVTLQGVEAFGINELRLLNKLQLWLERNQMCGSRYKEYLIANYGCAPIDETLQRPMMIGRFSTPIIVNSVIQTGSSETSDPLGTRAGVGSAVNAYSLGKAKFKEFGLVMAISFLRPKASYSQGINRMFIKQTVYDFYNPLFQSLGQQEIFNAEIFCDGSENDKKVFGYTDRYNEMRGIDDIYCGSLREEEYANWSVIRHFDSLPTLSSEFLEVKPSDYDYLFSVDSENAPQAFVSFGNVIKATRPLSKYAHPSL